MATQEVKVPDIGDFKDVPIVQVFVKPGDTVKVLAFRREELQHFELRLARQPPPRFVLDVDERASAAARRRRAAWCAPRRA